jgi:beta-glucosidase
MKRLRHSRALLAVSLGWFLLPGPALRAQGQRPAYLQLALPLETRVADLVARLTLPEKASLMGNVSPGVPRLGIPPYDWWNEALHGVARAGEATVFPQAIGLAAMWDDASLHAIADTISTEARAKHHEAARQGKNERYLGLTFWSPNINIFRDPRWGRGQETYGEDPFLTARLGVAFVRGLQGDDPRYLKAAACAKHWVVHSGPEPARHAYNVDVDERDFHETYLPAFEALVREARVEAVMTAYNAVNREPASTSPRLFDILYRQWGFQGHVVSDCGAVKNLFAAFKLYPDAAAAQAAAVQAGLCLTCGNEAPALVDAVRLGLITEAEIDLRLGQLLRTQFRLGFFDPPGSVPFAAIPFSANNAPAHAAQALAAAQKSLVLLKNDGLLPLDPAKLRRLAVIGPNADSVPALLGNYNGTPSAPVTVLAGLRAALGDQIIYERGTDYVTATPGFVPVPRSALNYKDYPGLEGDWFANRTLTGACLIRRRDRPIDYDWRQGNPIGGLPDENFSVRFTGLLTAPVVGAYEISVTANGGFRLYLDDKLVLDAWLPGQKTRLTARDFREGETIPLRLEYFQADGPAEISLKWKLPAPEGALQRALAAARTADAVVFVGGLTAGLEGEQMRIDAEGFNGGDRSHIELPAAQRRLLEALHATGKPVILVLLSGSAIAVPWADAHLPAVLQAWYPGQAGGTAVSDVLLGKYNPAGRLPVTFYAATTDLPDFDDYRMAGRTYRYFPGRALYPFGHGLSYTRFTYANLRVAPAVDTSDVRFVATVDVTNSGASAGDEVVQLYLREPASPQRRELQSLAGFKRINLAPGETRTVQFPVTSQSLRRWSLDKRAYELPRGAWEFRLGASSRDIRLTTTATWP